MNEIQDFMQIPLLDLPLTPTQGFFVVIRDIVFGRKASVPVGVASLHCSSGAGLEAALVHHLDEGAEV
jgi:hypothetical protein